MDREMIPGVILWLLIGFALLMWAMGQEPIFCDTKFC